MKKQKQFAVAMVAIMLLSVLILTVPAVMSGDENATLGDENVTNLTNVNKTNETVIEEEGIEEKVIEETATKEAMPPFPHDQAYRSMPGQRRPPFPRSLEEEKEFAEKRGQIPPIHGLEKNGECTYFRFTGNVKQLWDESHEGVDWTQAYPAGDLDGDGKEDVLVQRSEYDEITDTRTETVIAKNGEDGRHLWEESVSCEDWNCWIAAYSAGDLNGDGKGDVLVETSEYDEATDTRTAKVIAKNGENGRHLWEESVSCEDWNCWISAYSAGDLNGDEKEDVLVQRSEYDELTDTRTATVIAKNGETGAHLWEESVSGTGWWPSIYAHPAGDLNGDGKEDVLVQRSEYDELTDTRTETVIAKNGEDGRHLWEESVSCKDWNCWIDAHPAGDLNGDGKDDVLVHTYEYDEATDTKTEKVIAKKGENGAHLWEESVSCADWNCWIDAYSAGDLNGDGKDDVLVHMSEYDEITDTRTETVIAKRGFDGTHLWTAESDCPIWVAGAYWGPWILSESSSSPWDRAEIGGYDLNGDGIDDTLLGTYDTVYAVTTSERPNICQAIEDGVAWLARQQNADGSWGTSNQVAKTAFAVLKLETHAIDPKPPYGCGYGLDSPFDPTYPYADNVTRGLDYLFANANIIDIGTQTHDGDVDNPDTNSNGKGVYFSGRRTYETSIALMAIAASRTPDRIVNVPGSSVNGWTYKDVAQDTVDYFAWGQTDSDYGRGGWDYAEMDNAGGHSDNSNTGYVVLGLLYAESNEYGFKIPIPQFVRDELNIWIDYIQCKEAGTNYGGSGYDINPCGWVNTLKAGNLLFEMAFVGDTIHTQRVIDAVNYIERHWDDNNMQPGWRGDPAHYQAMYCLMKGLETLGIENITVNRGGSDVKVNWFAEFADVLVSQQNADGSWNDCPSYVWEGGDWGTHGGTLLCTEWALLTLQKEVPPPPEFCDPCVSIKVDVNINNNNGKIPYWPWSVFRYNVSVTNNQIYKPDKSRIAITYGLIDDPTSHTLIIGTRMPDINLNDTYNISGDFMVPDDVYSGKYIFFASAFDLETGCGGCNAVPFSVEMPPWWMSTTSKEESWENWLEIVEG